MMSALVSRGGRIATLTLFISVIAFIAYECPRDETFARLRSWYPLSSAPLPGAAPRSNESQIPFSDPSVSARSSPRVAVCLVGAARAFELTGRTLKKYVLNDTDIFLHSPLDENSHKFTLLSGTSGRLVRARIFVPEKLPESTLQREVLTGANSPNGIQGLLQYFNLVEGCLNMIHDYEREKKFSYDWIVRSRVDGYWSGPLPSLKDLNPSVYYIPEGSHFGGLNDRLGIGNTETSKVALSRLSILPLLHQRGGRNLNSETAFKAQLQYSKVAYKVSKFPFCILTYRTYAFPPQEYGVPVMALSTRGALNGAKCRPCTPSSTGLGAQDIISKLGRNWGWPGSIEGAALCDARQGWEAQWPEIYERESGEQLSGAAKNVTTRNGTACVQDVKEFQTQWEFWEGPPASQLCSVGKQIGS